MAEEKTLNSCFERLDEITRLMEDPQTGLEAQFDLYKEGMLLVKECSEKIDTVEKQMKIIMNGPEES